MRRSRRRVVAGRLGWALGLGVLLAPSLAEAQLFPNRTIRRERPDCATENPYYKTVRQNYFGYYPTCWSRFPAGWGCPCPNPELPNFQASLIEKPIKPLPPAALLDAAGPPGDDVGPGPGVPGPLDDRGMGLPPAPARPGGAFGSELTPRDPIVPGTGPGGNPGGAGAGTGTGTGSGTGTPPIPDPSAPPQTSQAAPEQPKVEVRPTATTLLDVPRINPPASAPSPTEATAPGLEAAPLVGGADALLTGSEATTAPAAPAPVAPGSPPMPDASTPPSQGPQAMAPPLPPSVVRALNQPPLAGPVATGTPAQAPRKRGVLTGLFDRQGRRQR